MLEKALNLMGCVEPFDGDGNITDEGYAAVERYIELLDLSIGMGLVSRACRDIEDEIDKIMSENI